MQTSKIELGQTYATKTFDFRATGIVTVRRNKSTTNYVEGVQVKPDPGEAIIEVKVEPRDIIDTVEERDRLQREAKAREEALEARKAAEEAKRHKAATLLAAAIGVTVAERRDYRAKGPLVRTDYTGIEVNDEALDALIAFVEKVSAGEVA
jgi:hypothetical protein